MIPRYYDGTTGVTGNGIGALRDAISCVITEERNGGYELEMEYPVDGLHYESLALRGLIKAKPNPYSEEQLFRVYKITRPLDGRVTVCAQHISYDLSGIPVRPCSASSATAALEILKSAAAVDCTFDFWTDLQTQASFEVDEPISLRSVLGGIDGSILDVYGGEYEWDNYTVKLHGKRGTDRSVTIRYGKNLTDIEQEDSCASVYTGVYPYWTDSDGNVKQISGNPIVNVPDAHYDFTRILTLDASQDYEDQPTDDQLRDRALSYIKTNKVGVPKVNLKLSYAQLEQTVEYRGMALLERVGLCDTVRVIFDRLGVDAESEVIKTTYNVLLGRYESIELGDARSTLANTVTDISKETDKKINKTATMLQQAVDKGTRQITGNMGGYVVIHSSDGRDEPDEILVMDEPDISTATRVWRWNLSGWGYSSTGYAGPYRLAATMDGEINADFITAGTMQANLIRAGVLTDRTGDAFYLDLDNGILRINATSVTQDGKDLETSEGADEKIKSAIKSFSITVEESYATKDALGAYTKMDNVRSAFAMDASSVSIESGLVSFKSGTITIDSDNFKLDAIGNVVARGQFVSAGDYSTASMSKGSIGLSTSGSNNAASIGITGSGSETSLMLTMPGGRIYVSGDTGVSLQGGEIRLNSDTLYVYASKGGAAFAGQDGQKWFVSSVRSQPVTFTYMANFRLDGNYYTWDNITQTINSFTGYSSAALSFQHGLLIGG